MARSTTRYGENQTLADVARDNRVVTATVLFVVLAAIVSVITNVVGFPVIAAMILAYSIVMVAVTVLFVIVPIYLLEYI